MKKIKKFFAILLILAIGIAVINSQTDFFLNFGSYVPYLKENCPERAKYYFYILIYINLSNILFSNSISSSSAPA